ncbi:MAG TPA: DUF1579 family protein [Thermoanaerobaculia bacterium]|jgi:hypothetical protein|nr:DUF1579 family protein [Thermoanaerobaculia bacterium]
MTPLEPLIAGVGDWHGTSVLLDPHAGLKEECASTARVVPLLGGRFVRLDYSWSYKGAPQEGSILIGFETKPEVVTAHWIDGWHMSEKVMACRGARPTDGTFSVLGSYEAPPGPDWGWRIDLAPGDGTLRLAMYNRWPDGTQEDLAVEAIYTRG